MSEVKIHDEHGQAVATGGDSRPKTSVKIEGGLPPVEQSPPEVPTDPAETANQALQRRKILRFHAAVQIAAGLSESMGSVDDSEIVTRSIRIADDLMKRCLA